MKVDIKKFKPISDLVLVEFKPVELKTESGIITGINKSVVLDRPTFGVVIAQGANVKNDLVGKKVYFENIRGQDIDETHLVLSEDNILGYEKI